MKIVRFEILCLLTAAVLIPQAATADDAKNKDSEPKAKAESGDGQG